MCLHDNDILYKDDEGDVTLLLKNEADQQPLQQWGTDITHDWTVDGVTFEIDGVVYTYDPETYTLTPDLPIYPD